MVRGKVQVSGIPELQYRFSINEHYIPQYSE